MTANNSEHNLQFWQQQFRITRDWVSLLESIPKRTCVHAVYKQMPQGPTLRRPSCPFCEKRDRRAKQLFSFCVTSYSLVKFGEWFFQRIISMDLLTPFLVFQHHFTKLMQKLFYTLLLQFAAHTADINFTWYYIINRKPQAQKRLPHRYSAGGRLFRLQ